MKRLPNPGNVEKLQLNLRTNTDVTGSTGLSWACVWRIIRTGKCSQAATTGNDLPAKATQKYNSSLLVNNSSFLVTALKCFNKIK